ncbi:patatin-like phospholipase family protein [Spirosoma endbachense]|uniref:Cyclic nucleotide-binding domain-containing protein n=1 Tax=Spirosoma endbachense TaxID=2666025 RepID=A0A6P1VZ33_9BACT|nr:patatin-like phospholipase family protein [Spirosoma endbachense]QHV97030.1 cyclic nucleotide-binding domain-containing protein [Spirosoma endbachense]
MPITRLQHELLYTGLTSVFGEFDDRFFALIEPKLQWVEMSGGDVLFNQNDPGDAMYFVSSGRLQVFVDDSDGNPRRIGEVMRGGIVGEMSILANEPHWATVIALRDSVLIKLSKEVFELLIAAYPKVAMNLSKRIIERLKFAHLPQKSIKKRANICLLALHEHIDLEKIGHALGQVLQQKSTVYIASSKLANQLFQNDIAQTAKIDCEENWQLSNWLDEQELQHDFLILLADKPAHHEPYSEWTRRCLREADEIVLIADAQQSPQLTDAEKYHQPGRLVTDPMQTLVLVHPANTVTPRHTADWLHHRPLVKQHYHIRQGLSRDISRLARLLSGTAIGLVLAGGGAKGFAHLGVLKALQEFNIPVDFVGGTSVGGLLAASVSFDQPLDIMRQHLKKAAFFNPTKDYNWLPLISLIRGKRIDQMIQDTVRAFIGHSEANIEDMWLTLFTVSSNYTLAREEIHSRGPLVKYLKATTAIPGVFPPVIDGDNLLVDGGMFNNFPVDVMSRMPVGKVIGVDLSIDKLHKMTIDTIPSPTELLRDRLRPKKLRKYRLPSLLAIMLNATLLSSAARRNETKQHLDLYFNPDVTQFGLMQWASFDNVVDMGYEHAKRILLQMTEAEREAFRG